MSITKFIAVLLIAFIVFVVSGILVIVAWFLFDKIIDFLERWL